MRSIPSRLTHAPMARREFLRRAVFAAGAMAVTGPWLRAEESLPRRFDPMETVTLGKSGIRTSRFSLGTGMRGGNRQSNHTRMGRDKLMSLLRESYERGIRLFDLADLYGTHPYLIPALEGVPRDRYQIVTKIWFRPGGIPEPERPDADVVVERFLRELKTDYIDLVLLHCVTSAQWPKELERQMEILARLKQKGVIRAHGVSCHSLEALKAAAEEPWVDSVHARINPFQMSMDGPPSEVVPVLRQIKSAGKGIVGMKIVGEGRLRNDPEKLDESIRFVLQLGCVDVVTVGCESIQEVDDFADRVRKVPVALKQAA
ncbi:MAG: aldo/keto reductase [Verrucomicrobiota bacterium]|nr:aldo/keto reductase [Limisphaera sp.]MDW8381761.1 aldo/keto reductase [Verrucomicrobiota bacterium]